ncbi:hypothetical protein PVAG01_02919 [Phlyctema vagabunda]|uniref:methylated diphthine methylhydrolase n=1 Tax=Phlyctema vagabunda TaxID=108571 RepID=A0ABR4PSF7_9HELO
MEADSGSGDHITQLCSTILDLPPSCIEFSPVAPEYFIVGTYNLQKEENMVPGEEEGNEDSDDPAVQVGKKQQSRDGSLILCKIVDGNLTLVQTLSYPSAILDLHFSPQDPHTFAIVSSTGRFSTFTLQTNDEVNVSVQHLSTTQLFPDDVIITSFVFHPSDPALVAVTLSTGAVHLFRTSTISAGTYPEVTPSEPVITHTLEAWCCNFSTTPGTTLYSGGDDARLRSVTFADLAQAGITEESIEIASPAAGFRGHEAGVTAILPLPVPRARSSDEVSTLLTGSYDDHVRVISISQNRARVLSELYIGGGVWRLKQIFVPSKESKADRAVFTILASCMHAGARILEVREEGEGEWKIEILGKVELHKSMNYGSDVQPHVGDIGCGRDQEVLCVSTSFYDKLLCVWKFLP